MACGVDLWLDWSPDGKRVAYSTFSDIARPESFVADLTSGALSLGRAGFPRWLPDGRLAVTVVDNNLPPPGCAVEVLDLASQQRSRVADGAIEVAFSPDGSLVALHTAEVLSRDVGIFGIPDIRFVVERRVSVARVGSDREPVDLGLGWLYDWSPDGSYLAFVGDGRVRIYSPSDERVFDLGTGAGTAPAWSPNGKMIALVRAVESDRQAIYIIDVDEPSRERFLTYGHSPSWSPDGKRIVFSR
jgi:Tol biopolymer transport system component